MQHYRPVGMGVMLLSVLVSITSHRMIDQQKDFFRKEQLLILNLIY